jgi:large subunit ribosomal protein L22
MSPAGRKGAPEGGWESLKVTQLQDELESRGLAKSGNKGELVARLEADDAGPAGSTGTEAEAARAEAGEAEARGDEQAEPAKKTAVRRGSAETSTRGRPKPAPRGADGAVLVSARAKYVRSAPRKARLVMDHIRGKPVEQARAILHHAPRGVSGEILKLLNSALANAESNHELGADELRIRRAFVDEGPTIKRYRPRALGRATRINKRTSHMTIELTTMDAAAGGSDGGR